jgi:hypothetical protein
MTEIYECECGKEFKSLDSDKNSAQMKFEAHIKNVLKRHGLKHGVIRVVLK